MKLNSDIINYIYSFLPIVDNKVKELNKSILNLHVNIYLSVINIYYIIFRRNDDYLSCLLNDIERWMNQDIATMRGYTPKYIDIVIKTSDMNEIADAYFTTYWSNMYSDPKQKFKDYIKRLSLIESINLYKFLIKINFPERFRCRAICI